MKNLFLLLVPMALISGCALFPKPSDPLPAPVGPITTQGTKFLRARDPFRIIGKSIDWAVQPKKLKDFKKLVDEDAALGINLYFAYGSPGLGKPLFVANESGVPYSNTQNLKRDEDYWHEVDQRIMYANAFGISVVVANTFVDQGVLTRWGGSPWELLREDWKWTVVRYKDYSVFLLPLSEYNEDPKGREAALLLLKDTTAGPISIHATKSSNQLATKMDFITHQGWNPTLIKSDLTYGKPVIIAEDQNAAGNADKSIQRFKEAEKLGAVYIFTGYNFKWDSKMKAFLKEIQ